MRNKGMTPTLDQISKPKPIAKCKKCGVYFNKEDMEKIKQISPAYVCKKCAPDFHHKNLTPGEELEWKKRLQPKKSDV